MLELLASIDPMTLPLWAVLIFAAGMYPVGMFLPCGPCCGCASCLTGKLPETITVTLSDFPETVQYQGPDLITVVISSACFGEGATARVTAPGGDPALVTGPITAIEVTNGGYYPYAKLGRVEPTITVIGGSGTGATFTPTIDTANDECSGIPTWGIASVDFEGGAGYLDGEMLTVEIAEGDAVEQGATVIVHTTRTEPTLEASTTDGEGAEFDITFTQNEGTPETWFIESIEATDGGACYVDGTKLTFTGEPGLRVDYPADAYIRNVRAEPTLSASVASDGVDAELSVSLASGTSFYDGRPYWYVDSISVSEGGTGYAEEDQIIITVDDGQEAIWSYFSARVTAVDENGAITAVAVDYGGEYFKDTGVIESVDLYYGGQYFDDDGVPTSVEVTDRGRYYREDPDADPYIANIDVTLGQVEPSDGEGAVLTAVVDDDTSSPTFGQITSITVDNGGDGYLAWQWLDRKLCCDFYNGKSFVLKRGEAKGQLSNQPSTPNPGQCGYGQEFCGASSRMGRRSQLNVTYNGPSSYPTVTLISENATGSSDAFLLASRHCDVLLTGTSYITDCDDFSFEATGTIGGVPVTATVTPGGDHEPHDATLSCFVCCQGADSLEDEVSISFSGADEYYQQYDGDYVMPFSGVTHSTGSSPYSSNARWSCGIPDIVMPGSNTGGELFAFQAVLSLCSANSPTEFTDIVEDAGNCNDCGKKCLTEVRIGIWTPLFGGGGPDVFQIFRSHRVGNLINPDDPFDLSVEYISCGDLCTENPQCGPAPGAYPVRQNACYGGGFGCINYPIGTVTIA